MGGTANRLACSPTGYGAPSTASGIGNKPIDGGFYLFTPEEMAAFISREPNAAQFFRRWFGAQEFINGDERWFLWLGKANPAQLRSMPEVLKRIEAVRDVRQRCKSAPTRNLAKTPTRLHVENMPADHFLLIPKVSSERHEYFPIGFMGPDVLGSDLVFIMPNATFYHFGVLTSAMHMAWVRAVCGRLKSDYRYSIDIVYNNFPWPENVTGARRAEIERLAQMVLDARVLFPTATLADLYDLYDLYDPNTMPPALTKAHLNLDRAVDRLYRPEPFPSDLERVELLFTEYQRLTSGVK